MLGNYKLWDGWKRTFSEYLIRISNFITFLMDLYYCISEKLCEIDIPIAE